MLDGKKEDRLHTLIYALRNLPTNFAWDYATTYEPYECRTTGCAIGLAKVLWPEFKFHKEDNYEFWDQQNIADFFGLTVMQIMDLFSSPSYYEVLEHYEVTPLMVADKLEDLIKEKEAA